MKIRAEIFPIIVLILSCNSANDIEIDLEGEWTMENVYEYGEDVTDKHNPGKNRLIRFDKDGTFVSDGDPHGRNNGKWRLEEGELYLDSDAEGDNSVWNVTFKDDRIIFTGIRHPRQENTKLVHKRR